MGPYIDIFGYIRGQPMHATITLDSVSLTRIECPWTGNTGCMSQYSQQGFSFPSAWRVSEMGQRIWAEDLSSPPLFSSEPVVWGPRVPPYHEATR